MIDSPPLREVIALNALLKDGLQPLRITANHPDRLGDIFDTQGSFLTNVLENGSEVVDFTHDPLLPRDAEMLATWVNEYSTCIMMEGAELKDWTPWKHWSQQLGNKSKVEPWSAAHIEEMRIECADILCFLVNACMALGLDSQGLYDIYRAKADINLARQASGTY